LQRTCTLTTRAFRATGQVGMSDLSAAITV
jgi:hypothetical protein